jgi:hypothetical protein
MQDYQWIVSSGNILSVHTGISPYPSDLKLNIIFIITIF